MEALQDYGSDSDRRDYINHLKEEKQNYIINTRRPESSTVYIYTWTHRTTSCDVISTVTTTIPMKNGNMKDIKMYNKEMRRIKAPGKKPGLNLYVSPLEGGATDSNSRSRKLCNDILKNEKIAFMNRLHKNRYQRTTLENIAAILIQKIFRGHWVRSHQQLIKLKSRMHLYMRHNIISNVNSYINSSLPLQLQQQLKIQEQEQQRQQQQQHQQQKLNEGQVSISKLNKPSLISMSSFSSLRSSSTSSDITLPITTLAQYRATYKSKYYYSALVIQCSYRCYLARVYIRRKRYEYQALQRTSSVIKIQSLVRKKIGYETVKVKKEKNLLYKKYRAALLIQSIYRKTLAKRKLTLRRYKLEWIAARMIQTVFRGRNTRKSFAIFRAINQRIKLFKASRKIQCMIRKKISYQRVKRLKLRRLYLKVYKSTVKIQTLIRKFLSKCFITKFKVLKNNEKQKLKEIQLEKEKQEMLKQAQLLSDSMDMFLQTQLGQISIVDSLYHHEIEAGNYEICNQVNSEGNTILSIAVKYGHLDLVRKCLLWGYDINHVNQMGESIIGIAAESNQPEIILYLLNYTPPNTSSSSNRNNNNNNNIKPSSKIDISDEDLGLVFISLAKNNDMKYMRTFVEKYSSKVNVIHPINECIALHIACELGNIDMCHLLLRNGSRVDIIDDMGQLPIHKACTSTNINIVKLLLGLGEDYSTIRCTSNFHRNELLLKKDTDGKDCLLLSALYGRSDIIKYLLTIIDQSKRKLADELGWSPNDILHTLQLAEYGNIDCLKLVFDAGFDPTWVPELSGTNMLMIACRAGKLKMIDYLLDKGLDPSLLDNEGRNCFHYAAQCTIENVIPYLLSLGNKITTTSTSSTSSSLLSVSSKLLPNLLLVQDKNGLTPVHLIAQYGSTLSFDLLANEQLEIAFNTLDNNGKTPLMIACSNNQVEIIKRILSLGCNTQLVDKQGKNALWHYFFPLIRDETQTLNITINPTLENDLIKTLLKSGCSLFSSQELRDMDKIQQFHEKYRLSLTPSSKLSLIEKHEKLNELMNLIDISDICAYEGKLSILNLFPELIDSDTCWKLVISCLYFGTTNNKAFASIFDGNAVPLLIKYDSKIKGNIINQMNSLQLVLYNNCNIFGWSIRAKNVQVITYLFRKGVNPNNVVDNNNNTALHYSALYGNLSVVDTVLNAHDEILLLETENSQKCTAAMISSKLGNFQMTKKMLRCGCNGRKALEGKYWGWLLALVREREKLEMNTQTGIYGDDDELYFSLKPEPNYLMWGWK